MSRYDPNDPYGFLRDAGLAPTRRSRGRAVAPPLSHSAPLSMTETEFLARGLFEDKESYRVYEDTMRTSKVDPADGIFSNLVAGFAQSSEDGVIQLQQIGLGVGIGDEQDEARLMAIQQQSTGSMGDDFFEQTAYTVGQVGSETVGTAALGALIGGGIGFLFGGVGAIPGAAIGAKIGGAIGFGRTLYRAFDGGYYEALNDQMNANIERMENGLDPIAFDPSEANVRAFSAMAVEGALEKLVPKPLRGQSKGSNRLLREALGEAGQEGLQEIGAEISSITVGETYDFFKDRDVDRFSIERLVKAGLMGSIAGGIVSGPTQAMQGGLNRLNADRAADAIIPGVTDALNESLDTLDAQVSTFANKDQDGRQAELDERRQQLQDDQQDIEAEGDKYNEAIARSEDESLSDAERAAAKEEAVEIAKRVTGKVQKAKIQAAVLNHAEEIDQKLRGGASVADVLALTEVTAEELLDGLNKKAEKAGQFADDSKTPATRISIVDEGDLTEAEKAAAEKLGKLGAGRVVFFDGGEGMGEVGVAPAMYSPKTPDTVYIRRQEGAPESGLSQQLRYLSLGLHELLHVIQYTNPELYRQIEELGGKVNVLRGASRYFQEGDGTVAHEEMNRNVSSVLAGVASLEQITEKGDDAILVASGITSEGLTQAVQDGVTELEGPMARRLASMGLLGSQAQFAVRLMSLLEATASATETGVLPRSVDSNGLSRTALRYFTSQGRDYGASDPATTPDGHIAFARSRGPHSNVLPGDYPSSTKDFELENVDNGVQITIDGIKYGGGMTVPGQTSDTMSPFHRGFIKFMTPMQFLSLTSGSVRNAKIMVTEQQYLPGHEGTQKFMAERLRNQEAIGMPMLTVEEMDIDFLGEQRKAWSVRGHEARHRSSVVALSNEFDLPGDEGREGQRMMPVYIHLSGRDYDPELISKPTVVGNMSKDMPLLDDNIRDGSSDSYLTTELWLPESTPKSVGLSAKQFDTTTYYPDLDEQMRHMVQADGPVLANIQVPQGEEMAGLGARGFQSLKMLRTHMRAKDNLEPADPDLPSSIAFAREQGYGKAKTNVTESDVRNMIPEVIRKGGPDRIGLTPNEPVKMVNGRDFATYGDSDPVAMQQLRGTRAPKAVRVSQLELDDLMQQSKDALRARHGEDAMQDVEEDIARRAAQVKTEGLEDGTVQFAIGNTRDGIDPSARGVMSEAEYEAAVKANPADPKVEDPKPIYHVHKYDGTVRTPNAKFVSDSLGGTWAQRFWYEAFGSDLIRAFPFLKGKKSLVELFAAYISATSPRTEVRDNLRRAIGLMTAHIAGRATNITVMDQTSALEAARGGYGGKPGQYKVGSFNQTLGLGMGTATEVPMATLDVIMARFFGIPQEAFANPLMYELGADFMGRLAALINSKTQATKEYREAKEKHEGKAELTAEEAMMLEPFRPWQLQAAMWSNRLDDTGTFSESLDEFLEQAYEAGLATKEGDIIFMSEENFTDENIEPIIEEAAEFRGGVRATVEVATEATAQGRRSNHMAKFLLSAAIDPNNLPAERAYFQNLLAKLFKPNRAFLNTLSAKRRDVSATGLVQMALEVGDTDVDVMLDVLIDPAGTGAMKGTINKGARSKLYGKTTKVRSGKKTVEVKTRLASNETLVENAAAAELNRPLGKTTALSIVAKDKMDVRTTSPGNVNVGQGLDGGTVVTGPLGAYPDSDGDMILNNVVNIVVPGLSAQETAEAARMISVSLAQEAAASHVVKKRQPGDRTSMGGVMVFVPGVNVDNTQIARVLKGVKNKDINPLVQQVSNGTIITFANFAPGAQISLDEVAQIRDASTNEFGDSIRVSSPDEIAIEGGYILPFGDEWNNKGYPNGQIGPSEADIITRENEIILEAAENEIDSGSWYDGLVVTEGGTEVMEDEAKFLKRQEKFTRALEKARKARRKAESAYDAAVESGDAAAVQEAKEERALRRTEERKAKGELDGNRRQPKRSRGLSSVQIKLIEQVAPTRADKLALIAPSVTATGGTSGRAGRAATREVWGRIAALDSGDQGRIVSALGRSRGFRLHHVRSSIRAHRADFLRSQQQSNDEVANSISKRTGGDIAFARKRPDNHDYYAYARVDTRGSSGAPRKSLVDDRDEQNAREAIKYLSSDKSGRVIGALLYGISDWRGMSDDACKFAAKRIAQLFEPDASGREAEFTPGIDAFNLGTGLSQTDEFGRVIGPEEGRLIQLTERLVYHPNDALADEVEDCEYVSDVLELGLRLDPRAKMEARLTKLWDLIQQEPEGDHRDRAEMAWYAIKDAQEAVLKFVEPQIAAQKDVARQIIDSGVDVRIPFDTGVAIGIAFWHPPFEFRAGVKGGFIQDGGRSYFRNHPASKLNAKTFGKKGLIVFGPQPWIERRREHYAYSEGMASKPEHCIGVHSHHWLGVVLHELTHGRTMLTIQDELIRVLGGTDAGADQELEHGQDTVIHTTRVKSVSGQQDKEIIQFVEPRSTPEGRKAANLRQVNGTNPETLLYKDLSVAMSYLMSPLNNQRPWMRALLIAYVAQAHFHASPSEAVKIDPEMGLDPNTPGRDLLGDRVDVGYMCSNLVEFVAQCMQHRQLQQTLAHMAIIDTADPKNVGKSLSPIAPMLGDQSQGNDVYFQVMELDEGDIHLIDKGNTGMGAVLEAVAASLGIDNRAIVDNSGRERTVLELALASLHHLMQNAPTHTVNLHKARAKKLQGAQTAEKQGNKRPDVPPLVYARDNANVGKTRYMFVYKTQFRGDPGTADDGRSARVAYHRDRVMIFANTEEEAREQFRRRAKTDEFRQPLYDQLPDSLVVAIMDRNMPEYRRPAVRVERVYDMGVVESTDSAFARDPGFREADRERLNQEKRARARVGDSLDAMMETIMGREKQGLADRKGTRPDVAALAGVIAGADAQKALSKADQKAALDDQLRRMRQRAADLKAKRVKIETARQETRKFIQKNLPVALRGKLLTKLTQAKTEAALLKVEKEVMLVAAQGRMREATVKFNKKAKGLLRKGVKMSDETRQKINQITAQAEALLKLFKKQPEAARLSEYEGDLQALEELHTELDLAIQDDRDLQKQNRREFNEKVDSGKSSVLGKMAERKGEAPVGPGGVTQSSMFGMAQRGGLDLESILKLVGLDFIWDSLVAAESAMLSRRRETMNKMDEAVRRAGFRDLADFRARTSMTRGRAMVGTRSVILGGRKIELTMGQYLKLLAMDNETLEMIAKRGQMSLRVGPAGEGTIVSGDNLLDDILKIRKLAEPRLVRLVSDMKDIRETDLRAPAMGILYRMTGRMPPQVAGYEPRSAEQVTAQSALDRLLNSDNVMQIFAENAGFTKQRGRNTIPVVSDFTSDYLDHLDSSLELAHMAEPTRLAWTILTDPDVRRAITAKFGSQQYDRILKHVGYATRVLPARGDKMLGALAPVTGGILVLSPTSWGRIFFGGLNSLMITMGAGEMAGATAKVMQRLVTGDFNRFFKEDVAGRSGYLWDRDSSNAVDRRVVFNRDDGASGMADMVQFLDVMNDIITNIARAGRAARDGNMSIAREHLAQTAKSVGSVSKAIPTLRLLDRFIVAVAVQAEMTRRKESTPSAETISAAENHIRRTQNTSSPLDDSNVTANMRADGSFSQAFLTFTSDPMKTYSRIYEPDVTKGRRTRAAAVSIAGNAAINIGVTYLWKMLLASLYDDEDEKEQILAEVHRQKASDRALDMWIEEALVRTSPFPVLTFLASRPLAGIIAEQVEAFREGRDVRDEGRYLESSFQNVGFGVGLSTLRKTQQTLQTPDPDKSTEYLEQASVDLLTLMGVPARSPFQMLEILMTGASPAELRTAEYQLREAGVEFTEEQKEIFKWARDESKRHREERQSLREGR